MYKCQSFENIVLFPRGSHSYNKHYCRTSVSLNSKKQMISDRKCLFISFLLSEVAIISRIKAFHIQICQYFILMIHTDGKMYQYERFLFK
jgi:hypothetical protein